MENKKLSPTQKLDSTLKTPEERNELVTKIINESSPSQLTPTCLEIFSNYILDAIPKEENKKTILTENRMKTVNMRETSYQGLVSKFENGEDGIYNLIANDKNIIFKHHIDITEKDIAEVPGLKELRDEIKKIEAAIPAASGKKKFLLKKQYIEMCQQQYQLKNMHYKPIYCQNVVKNFNYLDLSETITFDEKGEPQSSNPINFFDPAAISLLLCNYSKIKEDAWGKFSSDSWYMMEDLDNLVEETLKNDYPIYYDLVIYKIDGKQNVDIQQLIYEKHKTRHSVEYISSLWRNKIPKLLAEKAKEDYILWYYNNKEYGTWKRCSKCKEIKLAHNRFFSINRTSKDGFYSICKCCRNKKKDK